MAFSACEFLFCATVAVFIGYAFARHGEWVAVALADGVALNCVVVAAYGTAAWRRGERGDSLRRVAERDYRDEVRRQHPTMTGDSVLVALTALAPYVLTIVVAGGDPSGPPTCALNPNAVRARPPLIGRQRGG